MKTVNTVELKNHANQLLRRVRIGQPIIVTYRGKTTAALIPLTDEGVVDLLWEYSPEVQRRLRTAMDELHAGKGESLKTFAKRHGLA